MKNINKMIVEKTAVSISDYFALHNQIEGEKNKRKIQAEKTIKIAVLSSFTVTGIKEVLNVKCCNLGILPEFYIAPYSQYEQEIINKNSGLYKFNPELTIFFVDVKAEFGEVFYFPYRFSDEKRKKITDEKHQNLVNSIRTLSRNISGKIILHNFEVPTYSPVGILENKQTFGFFKMIKCLNDKLAKSFSNNSEVFVFDYDSFCSKHGKRHLVDYKMYYLGDIKLHLNFISFLCDEYIGFIKPLKSLNKKCIVLDLDNTLWGGIIGEDNFDGIKLGPSPEGRAFWEFQKHLLSLFERGVMLAINSRNNLNDALKVIQDHPYMILREEHFSAIQINWNDKVVNMRAIAEELKIGLDSLLFIDDDKINRELVKKALPEVFVVELPEDSSLYSKALTEINEFNIFQITAEDKKKGEMYWQQRKRNEYRNNIGDIVRFLKGLEIVMAVAKANSFTISRIAQLTQKTNQFNLTTRRYTEKDIKLMSEADNYLIISAEVKDKFGDNGITGVVILEKCVGYWRIDTFLLSCRVLGREIEKALLTVIVKEIQKSKCIKLIGEFIPTQKNVPAKDFYLNNGFKLLTPEIKDIQRWELSARSSNISAPKFIKIVDNLNNSDFKGEICKK